MSCHRIPDGVPAIAAMLGRATMHGAPSDHVKAEIARYVSLDAPTSEDWDGIARKSLRCDRLRDSTLWQCVRAVDPSFPDSLLPDRPWPRVPSALLVLAALQRAMV